MSEQGFGEQLLSVCLEKVTQLLSDDMYFARRHASCLATVLYRKWTRPQASNLTLAPAAAAAAAAAAQQRSQYYDASKLAMTCKRWCPLLKSGWCVTECL